MNAYDFFMSPLEKKHLKPLRSKIISKAYGKVLEIGAGTGANIPFYNMDKITSLSVVDKNLNKHIMNIAPTDTIFLQDNILQLPFENDSFDSIVETLVLCSVGESEKALNEIIRVLRVYCITPQPA